ncbi:hypothetical protein [Burkholderia cepacia]
MIFLLASANGAGHLRPDRPVTCGLSQIAADSPPRHLSADRD